MSVVEEVLTTFCKNCETSFEGKFCPNCSQKANTHRFTVKHLLHEFFHAFTHADKGILFLIKEMFRKPGKVALEYNAGKRKKYFNPITFLLITMALQLFLIQKTNIIDNFLTRNQQWIENISKNAPKSDLSESNRTIEEYKVKQHQVMEKNKIITFLFIPIFAFLTWVLFRKSKHNYAENLVFNVLVMGQGQIYFILLCIVPFVIYNPTVMFTMYTFPVVLAVYSYFAYRQFYQQRRWVTFFKLVVLQIFYYVIPQLITNLIVT